MIDVSEKVRELFIEAYKKAEEIRKMKTTEITYIKHRGEGMKVWNDDGVISLKLWKGKPPEEGSKFLGTLYIFPDGTAKVAWWEWNDC